MDKRTIDVISNGEIVRVNAEEVMYVKISDESKKPQVHMSDGEVYLSNKILNEVEKELGEDFLRLSRRCIAAVKAIYRISDYAYLNNGERIKYSSRNKNEIIATLKRKQKDVLRDISKKEKQMKHKDYMEYYKSFDHMPFAFADIEMVFDEHIHAVDWIFRYGNQALAELENIALEDLIGKTFGSIFDNMDSKWLISYQQAALYGKTLEIIDYSPEIDKYLHITCFPTFHGHCGCILKDITKMEYAQCGNEMDHTLRIFLSRILNV